MIKSKAKPFLKWAGGKNQLLDEFLVRFPPGLKTDKINKYIEPFIGGGAVFFDVAQKFNLDNYYIFDINEELVLTYKVVKNNVAELIEILKNVESKYLGLDGENRQMFYYEIRDLFNHDKSKIDFSEYNQYWIERAAQILFLNKTCFNGLFRVNSKGGFNVPFGKYKNPSIVNEDNLDRASKILTKAQIYLGDFTDCEPFVDNHTFVYFDPPYRPLSQSSSFTSYSKDNFNDKDHIRLAKFYRLLDSKGAKLMLSNSDPKNENVDDDFFDELYSGYNIERVQARRAINCNGEKRGVISELIVTNYDIKVPFSKNMRHEQELLATI